MKIANPSHHMRKAILTLAAGCGDSSSNASTNTSTLSATLVRVIDNTASICKTTGSLTIASTGAAPASYAIYGLGFASGAACASPIECNFGSGQVVTTRGTTGTVTTAAPPAITACSASAKDGADPREAVGFLLDDAIAAHAVSATITQRETRRAASLRDTASLGRGFASRVLGSSVNLV